MICSLEKVKKSIIFLFLFGILAGYAQDPQFTQFYANPLYLNPALAGMLDSTRTALSSSDRRVIVSALQEALDRANPGRFRNTIIGALKDRGLPEED